MPMNPAPKFLRLFAMGLLAATILTACSGPRMQRLSENRYPALPGNVPVDLYLDEIELPHEPLATIETHAVEYVDDEVKLAQMEELRAKARRLGANGVQNVRILAKKIKGFTADEQTPFASWRQGRYQLYFMRGDAIRIEEQEPNTLYEITPEEGWVTDRYQMPPKLTLETLPMPDLNDAQASEATPPEE